MGLKVGNDHKLYYNSGTNASPTWVEIKIVGDVNVPIDISAAQIDLRITNFVLGLPAKITPALEFFLAADIGGTVYDALRGFALARTQKQYASANGNIATSGTQWFKQFAFFTSFPWNQPTQEIASGDCVLGAGYTEESSALVEPAWGTT